MVYIIAQQAPLPMEYFPVRILEWVASPSPLDLTDPGIKPMSPSLASRFFATEPPEKPLNLARDLLIIMLWFLLKHLSKAPWNSYYASVQFSSVTQSCLSLCDPMNHSTPSLPVRHQLPEFIQTHVHRVGDAIQPSHLLSSTSPAPNPSQHQGLFQWVSSFHQVAKVLESQLHHQSFQWTPRTDLLQDGLVGSPCSPRDSQESSPTPQFKSISSLVLSFLYGLTLISIHDHWKNHSLD